MKNHRIKALLEAAVAQQLVVIALLQAAETKADYCEDDEDVSIYALRRVREDAEGTLSAIEGLLE